MLYCHFAELNYCYNIDFSVDNLQYDDGKNGRIWDGRIWEKNIKRVRALYPKQVFSRTSTCKFMESM